MSCLFTLYTSVLEMLSRGSDSTEVRGGRDNGARSVVSGRVPSPTPPECAHCTTVRAWLPQCCGSHRGPQVGAADLPKAGVPGRCACSFEAVPRVKVVAPGRGGTNEGSKSRSALGPRRSRFRRGPRLRRIPPAAQHSRIAKVDEHFYEQHDRTRRKKVLWRRSVAITAETLT